MKTFFRRRKINKLIIKIAKYKALCQSSERFTKGDTNSHFINEYHNHLSKLAVAEAELAILEAG